MTSDALSTECTGMARELTELRKQIASQGIILARYQGTDLEAIAMRALVNLVTEHDALRAEFDAMSKLAERAS